MNQILLLPVKPRWADLYVAGQKTADVKRLPIGCDPGGEVAIYATAPTMAIVATACVEGTIVLPRATDDNPYGWTNAYMPAHKRACLSADELRDYLEPETPTGRRGHGQGFVILLRDVRALREPVGLEALRAALTGFRVPHSYGWVYGQQANTLRALCAGRGDAR